MTAKQLRLMRYICGYQEAHGKAPSFAAFERDGFTRHRTYDRLRALEAQGFVRLDRDIATGRVKARAIEVLRPVPVPHAPDGAPLWVVPL